LLGLFEGRAQRRMLASDLANTRCAMTMPQPIAQVAETASADQPAVEDGRPPRLLLAVVNPAIRTLLRSSLHRLLSKQLMLLSVTGRRTGRTYTVPVGRHESNGTLVVSVSGGWRHNLRSGLPVRVTLDGRERAGYAEVEADPDRVAQTFKELLDRLGPSGASLLGLKLRVKRLPTVDEVRPAVAQRWLARVRLTDESGPGIGR
jgi:hypothetical protein